jgi:DnaJ-domain-containing protein 1
MVFRDYYSTLGIPENATRAQIRAALRKMALKYHPDRNHSSSAKDSFIAAYEAYRILVDPLKRDQYDMLYREHHEAQRARTATPFTQNAYSPESENFDRWTQQARAEGDFYSRIGFSEFLGKALVPLPILVASLLASLPLFLLNLILSVGWYVYSIRRRWIRQKLKGLFNKYPKIDRMLVRLILCVCTIGIGFYAYFNFQLMLNKLEEENWQRIVAQQKAQLKLVGAAGRADVAAMKDALAGGADVNGWDKNGETALLAVLITPVLDEHHMEAVLWLLDHDANPNLRGNAVFPEDTVKRRVGDLDGIPVDVAIVENQYSIRDKSRGKYARSVIKALLDKGAKVLAADSDGRTPLHVAAKVDSVPAAEILIMGGARIIALDNSGRTPLDYAESRQMIRLLEQHGATEH